MHKCTGATAHFGRHTAIGAGKTIEQHTVSLHRATHALAPYSNTRSRSLADCSPPTQFAYKSRSYSLSPQSQDHGFDHTAIGLAWYFAECVQMHLAKAKPPPCLLMLTQDPHLHWALQKETTRLQRLERPERLCGSGCQTMAHAPCLAEPVPQTVGCWWMLVHLQRQIAADLNWAPTI